MLLLQQPGKRKTVDEIAEKFGVSRRTIFRDFNALQEINVPVTWDKYAGYGVMKGFDVPPLMFNAQELATIMVGLNFVNSQVDKKLVTDAEGVKLKIKEVLPDELKHLMDSLEERTIVDPYQKFGTEKKEGGDWYILNSAIADEKRVEFRYRSKSGEEKIRKVDPYILVYFEDHWNMIGKSHLRGDIRNFILDRMSEIQILDEKAPHDGKINVEGLIFRSDESDQKVILEVEEFEISRLKANLPAKIFNKIEKKPKIIQVEFFFDNLDFMNRWLLQFGTSVKVLAPEALVEKRKVLLEEMLKN